jgi:hypothetical protein
MSPASTSSLLRECRILMMNFANRCVRTKSRKDDGAVMGLVLPPLTLRRFCCSPLFSSFVSPHLWWKADKEVARTGSTGELPAQATSQGIPTGSGESRDQKGRVFGLVLHAFG